MPKSSKKASGCKGRQVVQQATQADFTLAEFADAAPAVAATGRMKKATTKRWDKNVTELCVHMREPGNEALAWFEKDLSDFELDDVGDVQSENEEDTEPAKKERKTNKKKVKTAERFAGGVDYPYDVWCLIGDHIDPECVAKFGSLCKTAHTVIHSARFWSKMYLRYRVEECGLPEELGPRYMEKIHGMKPRVVRSLFFFYTPFVARVHGLSPFGDEPDLLLGSRCVLMWYRKYKNYWQFYFKFRSAQLKRNCPLMSEHSNRTHNSLSRFESRVDHNPEGNFSVLQITATHYKPLPITMGLQLVKTSISVGHAMRYHKIKLIFAAVSLLSRGSGTTSLSPSSVTLVIDQVVNVRVLRWWDPKYPYSNSSASTA